MKNICLALLLITSMGYIQAATTYYISNSGNDNNTGTSPADAWKTIDKLNSVLSYLHPGDEVLFKRGDVFGGEIIIPSGVSGNSDQPVVFGSYGNGDKPILSGSVSVTGWVVHAPNIWKTSITRNRILQVFENHRRLVCARTPNTGYYRIKAAKGNAGFTDSLLASSFINSWKNATLLFHVNEFWWEDATIDSSNTSGYVGFTYGSNEFNPLLNGSGYFIQNKYELLDTLNEWYFDSTAKTLYLYSPDDPSARNVSVSVEDNGLRTNWPWANAYITIKDINFREQNYDAIQLRGSGGFIVQGCDVCNTGQYGLTMTSDYSGMSRYNHIIENRIENCLANGIYTYNVARSVLSHNTVRKSGLYPATGGAGEAAGQSGMRLWFGDSLTITYNRVDSSGNCGMEMESGYSLVEKNVIDHSMLLLSDGAAIYNNSGSNNIYRNNFLRYTKGNMEAGVPDAPRYTKELYFDAAGEHNSTIENNTMISYADNAGIGFTPNTSHVSVKNNVIYQCLRPLEIFNYDPENLPVNTLEVMNNIFYANRKGSYPYFLNSFEFSSMFSKCDSNYLCNPYSDKVIEHFSWATNTEFLDFAQWKTRSSMDIHSKTSYFHWNYPADSSFIIMNDSDSSVTYIFQRPVTDLDNHPVSSVILPPFTSKVLVASVPADTLAPTAIYSSGEPSRFLIFPNPASDLLHIHTEQPTDEKVLLMDVAGKLVFSGNIQQKTCAIDILHIKEGMYILKIGNIVTKVVVQH